jgi:uncharacterized membrane protein
MFLKSFMVVVLKDVLYTLLKNFFINVYVAFINVYFAQSFQSMFVNSKIPHTSFKIQTFQQVVVQIWNYAISHNSSMHILWNQIQMA